MLGKWNLETRNWNLEIGDWKRETGKWNLGTGILNTSDLLPEKTKFVLKSIEMKICIINGPNLNLLGIREPGVYGNETFETFFETLKAKYKDIVFTYFQSNIEGEIINKLHETGFSFDGIILNAGGYTHTSVAIGDAIKAIKTPVVEVHISNIHAREDFRNITMISAGMKGIITGFGLDSYRLAIESFLRV